MAWLHGRWLLTAWVAFSVNYAAQGESPPGKAKQVPVGKQQVRTDRYGDPLPAGAVLRLGTVRLRHGFGLWPVVYSADGKTLASAGSNGRIRLWDAVTGKPRAMFHHGFKSTLYALAFSPDGKTLAAGGIDEPDKPGQQPSQVVLWDVATGKQSHTFVAPMTVWAVAFSPDGKLFAAGGGFDFIPIWDTTTGKEIRRLINPLDQTRTVVFSPDGRTLATGGTGQAIRLWDVATGQERLRLKGWASDINSLAFSADGRLLACGSSGKTISLWDPATGKEIRSFTGHQGGGPHNGAAGALSVAFSPDGKALASTGNDGTTRLWEVATGQERANLQETGPRGSYSASVAFSPDGKTLAAGNTCGEIALWQAATGRRIRLTDQPEMGPCRVAVSPDGKILATACRRETLQLWEARTGRPIGTIGKFVYLCSSAMFSPDGAFLASVETGDNTIRLWQLATGKEARSFPEATFGIFSPNSQLLATGGIRLREVATGRELWQNKNYTGNPDSLAFSADSKILAWGCQSYVSPIPPRGRDPDPGPFVVLLEAATGKELRRLPCQDVCWSIVFSPDGRTMAMAGEGAIQLCDGPLWQEVQQLDKGRTARPRHGLYNQIRAMAFSPDGKTLAAESADNSVCLWEVATGQECYALPGHQAKILSLAFAPDGKTLISGSDDTTALVWDLAPPGCDTRAKDLNAKDQDTLWSDLGRDDAAKAYQAVWTLVAAPDKAVPWLKQGLQSPIGAKGQQIHRLIADLDSDRFAVRERASKELEQLGAEAEPALREALRGQPSPEVTRRLEALLKGVSQRRALPTPAERQQLRALQVLEHLGTPEARDVLQNLAKGAPGTRLTLEAKASLERLARRAAVP